MMKSLMLATTLVTAMAFGMAAAKAEEARRLITVTGEASVSARPDMAVITTGVMTEAPVARDALDANSAAVTAVIESLKQQSIEARDLETTGFSLRPVYVYPQPRDGEPQKSVLTGFAVSNNVNVRVRDLSKLGTILDQAVTAGANSIGGITFVVSDQSKKLDEARVEAVKDARRKADLLAGAAGAKIGRVVSIGESGFATPMPIMAAEARALSAAPVPVEAGEQTLQTQVSVTFELVE
ncbi:MAG: SIMPL domain-containing protein [Labrys sp. (in: a-proteobacteria)]|jgi:uncharacterized protein YggE